MARSPHGIRRVQPRATQTSHPESGKQCTSQRVRQTRFHLSSRHLLFSMFTHASRLRLWRKDQRCATAALILHRNQVLSNPACAPLPLHCPASLRFRDCASDGEQSAPKPRGCASPPSTPAPQREGQCIHSLSDSVIQTPSQYPLSQDPLIPLSAAPPRLTGFRRRHPLTALLQHLQQNQRRPLPHIAA